MTTRCYTLEQVLAMLQLSRTAFQRARTAGDLPFLEELRPRIGRRVRYRADLIDQYLSGSWRPRPVSAALPRRRSQAS